LTLSAIRQMLNQTDVTSASPVSTCETRRRSWPLGETQDPSAVTERAISPSVIPVVSWGANTGPLLLNIVLGVGAPLTAAVVWGTWAAPKSPRRLHGAARLRIESAGFAARRWH
jgi:hypothetical protein